MIPMRIERLKVRDWRLALVWVPDDRLAMTIEEMMSYCEAIGMKPASREQLFVAVRECRDDCEDSLVCVVDAIVEAADGEKRFIGCYVGKDEYCGFRLPGAYRQRSLRFLCVR